MNTKPGLHACLPLAALLIALSGCASTKEPATVSLAVSAAAVDTAAGAGGAEFAPVEMQGARDKMAQARVAMAAHDFKLANSLATAAQADAKLAQAKAGSGKAQVAADALQESIRVLREELERNGS
ncbi:MAG: DUF4398 domain-containing protein [Pseudomonadota bacterium]